MLAKTCSQIGTDEADVKPRSKSPKLRSPYSSLTAADILRASKRVSTPDQPMNNRRESNSRSSSVEIKITDQVSSQETLPSRSSPLKSGRKTPARSPKPHQSSSSPGKETPSRAADVKPAASSAPNPFLSSFTSSLSPSHSGHSGCRDPLCRDPMCLTSAAIRNQQLLAAATGSLSSQVNAYSAILSAQQREAAFYQKNPYAAMAAMAAAAASRPSVSSMPHICSWVSGKASPTRFDLITTPNLVPGTEYCGRRFATSEELLIHVKTHTNLSVPSDPIRTSPSASRYHPYTRPSSASSLQLPPSIPPLGLGAGLHPGLPPPPPPHVNPYLHPYAAASLYSSMFARHPMI